MRTPSPSRQSSTSTTYKVVWSLFTLGMMALAIGQCAVLAGCKKHLAKGELEDAPPTTSAERPGVPVPPHSPYVPPKIELTFVRAETGEHPRDGNAAQRESSEILHSLAICEGHAFEDVTVDGNGNPAPKRPPWGGYTCISVRTNDIVTCPPSDRDPCKRVTGTPCDPKQVEKP